MRLDVKVGYPSASQEVHLLTDFSIAETAFCPLGARQGHRLSSYGIMGIPQGPRPVGFADCDSRSSLHYTVVMPISGLTIPRYAVQLYIELTG